MFSRYHWNFREYDEGERKRVETTFSYGKFVESGVLIPKVKNNSKKRFFNQQLIAREAKQFSLNNLGNMTYYRFKLRTSVEINDQGNYEGERSHDWGMCKNQCESVKHVLVWL